MKQIRVYDAASKEVYWEDITEEEYRKTIDRDAKDIMETSGHSWEESLCLAELAISDMKYY